MSTFRCPFTDIEIPRDNLKISRSNFHHYYYPIPHTDGECYISICIALMDPILRKEFTEWDQFNQIKSIILYEAINNNLKELGGEIIHWDCGNASKHPNQLVLKDAFDDILRSGKYPINRKQKTDNFLISIKNNQKQDGDELVLIDKTFFWGNLFFKGFKEMIYYGEELERKNFVSLKDNVIRLTFEGQDYVEEFLMRQEKGVAQAFSPPEYEIGLSFAGEQREYVEQVANALKAQGVNVFYDTFEQIDLWGKDLYQHLNEIYRTKCKYCIVFLSKDYAKKVWTKHELKAAQARAFQENKEYILPVRFDDTEMPGINLTTGYLSTKQFSPDEIAEMAIGKLHPPN